MIAKRAPWPIMIELTKNAVGETSGPACSVVFVFAFGAGFHPIGQNGLRLFGSSAKDDLFFSSIFAAPSSPTLPFAGAISAALVGFSASAAALAADRTCRPATTKSKMQVSFF